MIETYTLKFLDLFRPVFRLFRIDYPVMRKILQMKLKMDGRRVPTVFQAQKEQKGNQFLKSLGIYALFGLTTIPFVFFGENYLFWTSLMFGVTMFILGTTMISDYSSVLLDVRDKVILNTKPISLRTINVAKMIHISIYLLLLLVAFSGIPSLVILGKFGILFFLIYVIELILLGFFIIALTALVYIFILRFFSGEKLKDMINYMQIGLTAGIFIGYQVLIRAFEFVELDFTYVFSWWHVFIPPIWFGAPFELLMNQNVTTPFILLSLLAILIPIGSLFIYFMLMPAFEQNLEKLMEDTGKAKQKKFRLRSLFSRLICTDEEQKYFRFSSIMMSQEREFKLKVYPALGMSIIFPFIMIFNQLSTITLKEVGEGKTYLVIYFCNLIIASVIHMLKFSGNYKGSWLLKAIVPIEDRGTYYRAAIKAFFVKIYIQIFIFISAIFVSIFSVRIIPDLLIIFISAILISVITFLIVDNGTFPFSQPFEFAQEGSNVVMLILLMVVVAIFAGVHFMFTFVTYGVWIYFIVLSVITLITWKMAFAKKRFVV